MKLTKTKVIATIGPACSSLKILEQLFFKGVNVCRLNFSHGTHEDHLKVINRIRQLNKKHSMHVAILADLQGPKLRVGEITNNGVDLIQDSTIKIVNQKCTGTSEKVYLSYQDFPKDVKKGDPILIDDGKIKLEVEESNGTDTVIAKVVYGGILSSRKGVNLPGTRISQPSMTEKDLQDAEFALEHKVDWIALSFVRSAQCMIDLKELIMKKKLSTRVIAKIEKPEALEDIDNIIEVSHGIMIARGDLGVEVSFERVPLIQKEIIQKCINQGRAVIIATQMMESMIENFRPTRAETNDVASAVLDGADCLMLSGETSVGKFPVNVVQSMKQIIAFTEQHGFHFIREHLPAENTKTFLPDTICNHASKMAEDSNATAIISFTHSGYTTLRISSHRPSAEIYAFTNNKEILNSLSILWGVRPMYVHTYNNINIAIKHSIETLKKMQLVKENDIVVHLGSIPINLNSQTNMLKISYV